MVSRTYGTCQHEVGATHCPFLATRDPAHLVPAQRYLIDSIIMSARYRLLGPASVTAPLFDSRVSTAPVDKTSTIDISFNV